MKTVVIESRVNMLRLAECCLAFEQQRVPITSKSSLVAACVEALSDVLKQNGATITIEDDSVAEAVISRTLSAKAFDVSSLNISQLRQSVLDTARNFNTLQRKVDE